MVDGKAATEIRMIVYASGCEIQQFVIPLAERSRVSQEFPCQPVETVKLSGHIVPDALVRDTNAELVVTYMAYWAHGFYGIADGFVTGSHLATVSPDANGMFQVGLPYFSADVEASSSQQRASFWLMLRDSKTWNPIASNLEPEKQELRLKEHGLRIRSHYPDDLIFTAESFVQLSTIKGKFSAQIPVRRFPTATSSSLAKRTRRSILIREPMRRANIFLEAFRPEITRCLSMRGFQKGVTFPARIPSNKRRRTVATSRSNGSGRVRHSWKSSPSNAFPSN